MFQIASLHFAMLNLYAKGAILFFCQDIDRVHNPLQCACVKGCPFSPLHKVMPGEALFFRSMFLAAFHNLLGKGFRKIPVKGPAFKKFDMSQIPFLLCRFWLRNVSLTLRFRPDPLCKHGISHSDICPADRDGQRRFTAHQVDPCFGPCDSRIVNIPP